MSIFNAPNSQQANDELPSADGKEFLLSLYKDRLESFIGSLYSEKFGVYTTSNYCLVNSSLHREVKDGNQVPVNGVTNYTLDVDYESKGEPNYYLKVNEERIGSDNQTSRRIFYHFRLNHETYQRLLGLALQSILT